MRKDYLFLVFSLFFLFILAFDFRQGGRILLPAAGLTLSLMYFGEYSERIEFLEPSDYFDAGNVNIYTLTAPIILAVVLINFPEFSRSVDFSTLTAFLLLTVMWVSEHLFAWAS